MKSSKMFKVFILEDEHANQEKILGDLKEFKHCKIHFFSKADSVFDLLNFSPDVVIYDYFTNKMTRFHLWNIPY
jgi:hypothetical protein